MSERRALGQRRPAHAPSAPGTAGPTSAVRTPAPGPGNFERLHALGVRPKVAVSQPGDAEDSEGDRAVEAWADPGEHPVAAGSNRALLAVVKSAGLQARLKVDPPASPAEREADRIADTFVPGGRPADERAAPVPGRVQLPALPTTGGARLPRNVRGGLEPLLGTALDHVRVHTGSAAQAATDALSAHAFTRGTDIFFGNSAWADSKRGRWIMAHEVAHAAGNPPGARARLQRQPRPDSLMSGGTADGFVVPPELLVPLESNASQLPMCMAPPPPLPPDPTIIPPELLTGGTPPAFNMPVSVAAPSLTDPRRPRRDDESLIFNVPVTPAGTFVYYAVPPSSLFPTVQAARATHVPVPPPTPARTAGTMAPPVSPPPAVAGPSNIVVGSTLFAPDGTAHTVLAATPDAVVTATYTKYAVGAGSTGLLQVGETFVVIDAGVFGLCPEALKTVTVDNLVSRVGNKSVQVLLTHAHLDHYGLLPALAERVPISAIRLSAIQAESPALSAPGGIFDQVRSGQRRYIRGLANEELARLETERPGWEEADRGDPMTRRQRWNEHCDERIRGRLSAIPDLQIDRIVPGARGQLRITSTSLDPADPARPRIVPASEALAAGVRAPGITDPRFADELPRRIGQGPPGPVLDSFSTSWIVDVRGHTRFLVLPDVRGHDFEVILHEFRRQTAALGLEARFQVWDVSHHMQSGWADPPRSAPGTPAHPAPRSELAPTGVSVRATQLGHISHFLHQFRAGREGGPGHDAVVVSAYEGFASTGTSYVDPANVWILRSLGFEVFLATSGQDVHVYEVITSQNRRVTGVSGAARGGLRPQEQLLRRAEAALDELRQLRRNARNLAQRARETSAKQAAQAEADLLGRRITAIDALRLAYLEAVHTELSRSTRGSGAARPAVAPADGAPEPAVPQRDALSERLSAEGFNRPIPTAGDPRFTDVALVIARAEGPLDPNAPAGSEAARALEMARARDAIRSLEMRPGWQEDVGARARMLADLHRYRLALEAEVRVPGMSGPSRALADDELRTTRQRIAELTPDNALATNQRIRGLGARVETRVESRRPLQPAESGGPTTSQRVAHGINAVAGRAMGTVMLYHTISAQDDVMQRYREGRAREAELAVSTAHNALSAGVAYRMIRGIEVQPHVFVLISVLDVAQTAMREYDSVDQRNTEVAYAVARAAMNLALMYVGGLLISTGNPLGVVAGLVVMMLGDTILEALGARDWLERMVSFLPGKVTAVEQQMRTLIAEYRIIIGAIELAELSASGLAAVGSTNPGATQTAARALADKHRVKAFLKEDQILRAFSAAYGRVREGYAGLAELDEHRRVFYGLMQRAHPNNEEFLAWQAEEARQKAEDDRLEAQGIPSSRSGDPTQQPFFGRTARPTRDVARETFEEIDRNLQLGNLTSSQVMGMEQWDDIDVKLEVLNSRLSQAYFAGDNVDYPMLQNMGNEAALMVSNARYRVQPPPGSYRTEPLLPRTAPGYATYMYELGRRERRLLMTQYQLARTASGHVPRPSDPIFQERADLTAEEREHVPTSLAGGVSTRIARGALRSFQAARSLAEQATDRPSAELIDDVFIHSAGRAPYETWVRQHGGFRRALEALELAERNVLALVDQAQRDTYGATPFDITKQDDDPLREDVRRLRLELNRGIQYRREGLGFFYLWELPDVVAEVRRAEVAQLAPLLSPRPTARQQSQQSFPEPPAPLSDEAMAAAREPELRLEGLGTIENRLQRIGAIRRRSDGTVEGVWRLVGDIRGMDIPDSLANTQVVADDNVLVADLGAGETEVQVFYTASRRFPTRRVIALNSSALRILGGARAFDIRPSRLKPVRMTDLRP